MKKEPVKAEIITESEEPVISEPKPDEKTKRKRRARTKKPVEPPIQSGQLLKYLFNDVISKRAGDHWKLEKEEVEALGNATDNVLIKYMPALDQWKEEFALVSVAALILGPRFMVKSGKPKRMEPVTNAE